MVRRDNIDSLLITRLRLLVIALHVVDISRFNQYSRFRRTGLSSLVDTELVVLHRLCRITVCEVDISDGTVDIIQLVLVLTELRHLLQRPHSRLTLQDGLIDLCMELHVLRRHHLNAFLIRIHRLLIATFHLINLSQHILEARFVETTFLIRQRQLDKRNSFVILLTFQQHIRLRGRILRRVLATQRIHIHLIHHIFRFVLPTHLGIRTRHPQLTLCHHVRIVVVVLDDIVKSSDGTEEISLTELRFTQTNPYLVHLVVELFLLEPFLVFRVLTLLRIGFGFRLDRVQLDALAAFLYHLIHLRGGRFCSFVITHRIKRNNRREIILVRLDSSLLTLLKSNVAVVEDVVLHLGLVERTRRRSILLRRTARSHQDYQSRYQ